LVKARIAGCGPFGFVNTKLSPGRVPQRAEAGRATFAVFGNFQFRVPHLASEFVFANNRFLWSVKQQHDIGILFDAARFFQLR